MGLFGQIIHDGLQPKAMNAVRVPLAGSAQIAWSKLGKTSE